MTLWSNSSYAISVMEARKAYPTLVALTEAFCHVQTVISTVGNVLVMFLTLRTPNLRSKTHNYIIFGMAVSDILFCWAMSTSSLGLSFMRKTPCAFGAFVIWNLAVASFGLPAILAVNRYIAMYRNHVYDVWFSSKRVVAYVALNFLLTALMTLPYHVLDELQPDPTFVIICGPQMTTLALNIHYNVSFNGYFTVAYIVIVWFNWKNVQKLRDNQNNASGLRSPLMEESEKLIKMMIIVSILPLPVQWPAIFFKTIGDVGAVYPRAGMISASIYPLAATINPYITLSVVQPYRKAFRALIRKGPVEVAPAPNYISNPARPSNPNPSRPSNRQLTLADNIQ